MITNETKEIGGKLGAQADAADAMRDAPKTLEEMEAIEGVTAEILEYFTNKKNGLMVDNKLTKKVQNWPRPSN